jgi:2,3-bisphosphoglycerate-independent phosphoglycerate mutase
LSKIKNKPVLLCILDGFGIGNNEDSDYDAIKAAQTPCIDYFLKNFPHTELQTSGKSVGLPEGQMGNSEVGHITIGSGRVISQDLPRINQAISNGEFENHPLLKELVEFHNNKGKNIHLLGLCSDGGVHSHIEHLIFLAKLLAKNKINIWILIS